MKLYLIRHSYAESSSGGADFDRALTSEGLNMVRELGRHLRKSPFNPSKILCSTSRRTRETALNLIEELEMNEKSVEYKDVIYNASVRELLGEISEQSDEINEVALIGHNPTITYFAEYLTGETIGNMEPCSIVTISFVRKIKWEKISQASGQLSSYFHPKQSDV